MELAPFIFLAAMKDEIGRLRVNCRRSNLLTKRYSYTMKRMEECIDFVADTPVLFALHPKSGLWHVEIELRVCNENYFQFTSQTL